MDETRKLLKVIGVAVTVFESEAEKLEKVAAELSSDSGKDEIANLLKEAAELCCELNTRWLETTQHIVAAQNRLLSRCAEAVVKPKLADDTTEIESARMEAGE